MIPYLTRRAVHSAFALLGLIIAVFFLARLTGDPTDLFLPVDASRDDRIEFARKHGYDRPATEQFVRFVGNVMEGDLGFSLRKQRPAVEVVLEAYPTTLKLAGVTLLIGISLAGASAPDFWVAITAILFFSVSLRWLPTSGTGGILFWIMPVTVLALRPFGLLVQVVRGAMLDSLASAYVKTARAKGVGESTVIFVHALRNACLAVVTVAGNLAVGLINGAVIVETVFGWPGVGKLMIDAVIQRDFAVVQASIMVTAIAIFLMNILIDMLYAALDPRIRHQ